jgi:hypothetical protein
VSHWFDRLTVRATGDEPEGLITRRETVMGAAGAAGAVVAGSLGWPWISAALAGGRCDCQRRADKAFNNYLQGLNRDFLLGGGLTGLGVFAYIAGVAGVSAGRTAAYVDCVLNNPQSEDCDQKGTIGKAPPPEDQPCLARGGVARRDQCGGEVKPEPPQTGCAQGTHDCGGGLCCFGSDLCCGGCCCIVEVGCGCCG